jgi:hypothetical protein
LLGACGVANYVSRSGSLSALHATSLITAPLSSNKFPGQPPH